MITVIIAGGSGTRLWPLSTPKYPKHLLRLVGDDTMLQLTYERAKSLGDEVYVITEASHAHHVKEQLSGLDEDHIIVEPGRRGTANCIVMALDVLSRNHERNESIGFIHSDHHIQDMDGFKASFEAAAVTALDSKAITLIGIEPTFPATGFGYIQKGDPIDESKKSYKVLSFKEKPDVKTASKYLESGDYIWNCGYFVGSIEIFLREMDEYAPDLRKSYDLLRNINNPDSNEYKEAYLNLESEVIDTALIEKSKNLAVVAASFDWMDIGSFKDLHLANDSDYNNNHFSGKYIYDHDSSNVFVRNEEKKPVVVIGVKDVAVINTPNGVLVIDKEDSLKIKEVIDQIRADFSG